MEPQDSDPVITLSKEFARTYLRVQRLLDRHLAAEGASLAKLRLLAYLGEESRRAADIANHFGQAPRTVTQAIDGLEVAGLVVRMPIKTDRRAKLITITDHGRVTLKNAQPLYEEILSQTFGALTGEERASLCETLEHLNSVLTDVESSF